MANKNVTLSIETELLNEARKVAAMRKTTVNALFREYLKGLINKSSHSWIDEFWLVSENIAGTSRGKKWSRDELHER
jgi:hypothetical protein